MSENGECFPNFCIFNGDDLEKNTHSPVFLWDEKVC